MARFTHPTAFDFYHSSPALDSKTVFSADDDMSVLDDKILDSTTASTSSNPSNPTTTTTSSDLSSLSDPRRSSFDHSPADDFSRRDSIWSDRSHSQHPAAAAHLSPPLFESTTPSFVRLDTTSAAAMAASSSSASSSSSSTPALSSSSSYAPHHPLPHSHHTNTTHPHHHHHHQQPWPLSADSGSCTPTPLYDQFSTTAHDYDGNPAFAGGAVGGPVNPMSFSHIPYRPGSTYPHPTTATTTGNGNGGTTGGAAMSPQSSQGWVSPDQPHQDVATGSNKPIRNPASFRPGSSLHIRRDGIRKKNARFDIPAERTLSNIDLLISQSTDEDEIKELKQQKRLLRNRQAAYVFFFSFFLLSGLVLTYLVSTLVSGRRFILKSSRRTRKSTPILSLSFRKPSRR